jgi:AraC-like DNA-binding protein
LNSNIYIPQASHLKSVIHSIWQIDRFTSYHKEHIIPNGIVEVIFNFSDGRIPAEIGGKQCHLPHCFINGFNTTPIRLNAPRQQVFFGVRLQPLAAKKLFGSPASLFSDVLVDLTLLDQSIRPLWHQLAEETDFDNRVDVLSRWVEQRSLDWQPREYLLNHFLCAVNQHDLTVTGLASSLCYSRRQLSRKIFEVTGMNTEEVLLYKKYLHAVHLIHHTDLSLTKIAYQSHFSDQSHFIKSFKSFTNLTPGEYHRTKGYLQGHIYENVR